MHQRKKKKQKRDEKTWQIVRRTGKYLISVPEREKRE